MYNVIVVTLSAHAHAQGSQYSQSVCCNCQAIKGGGGIGEGKWAQSLCPFCAH